MQNIALLGFIKIKIELIISEETIIKLIQQINSIKAFIYPFIKKEIINGIKDGTMIGSVIKISNTVS